MSTVATSPPRSDILQVKLSTPALATSRTVETGSGRVQWDVSENTLRIQPEFSLPAEDARSIETLVRTVMRRSGLARRFHVFSLASDAGDCS